jgi:hypothetical protein
VDVNRRPRATGGAAILGCCALLLGACSSSAQNASSTASPASVKATCEVIGAALADGPDPSADPVGYAEAQVLPLRQVRTDDAKLQEVVKALARAYQQQFASDGAPSATRAVNKASGQLNAICPGVAS